MTRSAWFASFSPARRSDLYVAANEAAYFGKEVIARYVEGKGGTWIGKR